MRALGELETLDISRTKVTDAGLTELEKLIGLKELKLAGCAVTDAGVARLQAKIPTCRIVR